MPILIKESDLKIEFFRGSGPGGQHRNVTDSAVRIRHVPTGIVVQAAENRSQARNREAAMKRLEEALERRAKRIKRRIKTDVPMNEKVKRLENKKRRSHAKQMRIIDED